MFENLQLRGMISVMGAFLISLSVGIMYLWGIITIYGTSYFRIVTKNVLLTQDNTDIVFPLTLLGQAISIPLVSRFAKKVSSSVTCFSSGIIMALLIYFSSYTQNFSTFALLFGLGNGIIIGVIYILPIAHCFQYYPKKKTAVSIILISASGIGTLIFSLLAIDCINPQNMNLQTAGYNLYYGKQIAFRFPQYLKLLSGVTLAFVSGGGLLLCEYPRKLQQNTKKQIVKTDKKQQNLSGLMDLQFHLDMDELKQTHKNPFGNMNYELTDLSKNYENKIGGNTKVYGARGEQLFWPALQQRQSDYKAPKIAENIINQQTNQSYNHEQNNGVIVNECPRTSDGPRQCVFWTLFFIITLGANFGLMISVNYKTYVKNVLMDDRYLTFIGAFGAVACGFSRFFWGSILEKKTFKFIYYAISLLNLMLAFTISFINQIKQIYLVYVILAYICYGGMLGMFPAITSQIFGVRYGPQIYGIMFFAFPISNLLQFLLVNYVEQGYFIIFKISGIMSIASMFIVKRLQLDHDWSDRIRQNNQRRRLTAR